MSKAKAPKAKRKAAPMSRTERYQALVAGGLSVTAVAAKFGVSRQAVSQAVHADAAAKRRRRHLARKRAQVPQVHPGTPCPKCGSALHNTMCEGKGKRCAHCQAINPHAKWLRPPWPKRSSPTCPRCGMA